VTACQQASASGGGPSITLNASYAPSSSTISPTAAACQFELTSGGDIRQTIVTNTVTDVGDWLVPKFGMSGFDCMLTVNSGTAPSGAATATWLNLGTTRTWTLTQAVVGSRSNNCTLQIRNAVSLIVLDSATVTMEAEVN